MDLFSIMIKIFDLGSYTLIPLEEFLIYKEYKNEEIDTITKWAHKYNFPISTQLIQGLPFETKETFMDTIEYLFQKCSNFLMAVFWVCIL